MFHITKHTLHIFAIAILFFVVAVGVTIGTHNLLGTAIQEYKQQLQLLANADERERTFFNLSRTLAESEVERAQLNTYFLDVVEIAQFLEMVESHARQSGLSLSSRTLSASDPDQYGVRQVRIPYSVTGQHDQVRAFIELLETLPYHSWLERIALEQVQDNRYSAEVEVVVSSYTYD